MVQRAFLLGGVRQEPTTIVEVSESLARELIHMGKAAPVADDPAPVPAPMTVSTTPALVPPVADGDAAADESSGDPVSQEAPRRRRKGNE